MDEETDDLRLDLLSIIEEYNDALIHPEKLDLDNGLTHPQWLASIRKAWQDKVEEWEKDRGVSVDADILAKAPASLKSL